MLKPAIRVEIADREQPTVVDFYRDVFGWHIDQQPGADYWRIRSGDSATDSVNGVLTYKSLPGIPAWLHYVTVPSLDETLKKVRSLGGMVLRPKTTVADVAWYAIAADPEGNIFAIWQAQPGASGD